MRQPLLTTAMTFLSAGAGLADGAALILGNERYDDLDRGSRGDDVLEVGEGLVDTRNWKDQESLMKKINPAG